MQCVDLHGCLADSDRKAMFLEKFVSTAGKTYDDASRYYDVFLDRYLELESTVSHRVAGGNLRATKGGRVKQLLKYKMEQIGGRVPYFVILFNYYQNINIQKGGRPFLEEVHNALLYLMYKHEYGSWGNITREFHRLRLFQFNSLAQAVTEVEVERLCNYIIRVVEKEVQKFQGRRTQLEQVSGP
jgi:hypothetical protein